MRLEQALADYLPLIEAEMRALVRCSEPRVAGHYGMMQYHLGWVDSAFRPVEVAAGKRIRPLLCVLACAAARGDPATALPAAAGLELLHNFSLIHDDIEDGSATRRHRPTLWRLYGMPQACNAGDGMLSLAHLAFHRLADCGVAAPVVLTALKIFDETCLALTEGQYLDMAFEARTDVTVEEYFGMVAGKTGALLAAAPQIGALIAGAPADVVAAYRAYGAALGRAFQFQDDVLGIWGDEAVTGKPAAGDILSKKKSLPVAYALNHPQVGAELANLYGGRDFLAQDVPAVLALLEAAGARAFAEAQVLGATMEAHAALDAVRGLSEASHLAVLEELLDSLVGRTF